MKAVIKEYYSIDIPDLFTYKPANPSCFGFVLQFILGLMRVRIKLLKTSLMFMYVRQATFLPILKALTPL